MHTKHTPPTDTRLAAVPIRVRLPSGARTVGSVRDHAYSKTSRLAWKPRGFALSEEEIDQAWWAEGLEVRIEDSATGAIYRAPLMLWLSPKAYKPVDFGGGPQRLLPLSHFERIRGPRSTFPAKPQPQPRPAQLSLFGGAP